MQTKNSARDKALRERQHEFRQWQRWRRERTAALLAGPYAEPAQALVEFLKDTLSTSALIEFVAAGPWQDADAEVRAEILGLIDIAIIAHREKLGLVPFDDPLPGASPNVFLIVREQLAGIPA
jgi:hypothetical protein